MKKQIKIAAVTILMAATGQALTENSTIDPASTHSGKTSTPFPYTAYAPYGYPAGYGLATTVMPVPRTPVDTATIVDETSKAVVSK